MGDYSRCPHGATLGYCMECNMTCEGCMGQGTLEDGTEDGKECGRCRGLGLVPRTKTEVITKGKL